MKCDICHKNDATIHIQEITDGANKKLNLCVECAAKKKISPFGMEPIDLSEIIYNLSEDMKNLQNDNSESKVLPFDMNHNSDIPFQSKVCSCGWTGLNLRKTGRLGCAECYQVFEEILQNTLKNMHRNTIHIGKRPEHFDLKKNELLERLAVLQKELDTCVKNEEYEQAAHLRDEINDLKTVAL
jgi:protein arginine kinase activator